MDSSLVQLRKLESRSKRYCTRVFCSLPHSFNRHLRLKQQTKTNKKNPDKKRDELLSISARSSVDQFRRPRATMQNTVRYPNIVNRSAILLSFVRHHPRLAPDLSPGDYLYLTNDRILPPVPFSGAMERGNQAVGGGRITTYTSRSVGRSVVWFVFSTKLSQRK